MSLRRLKIVEVGPRDGLQNERSRTLSVPEKVELISKLVSLGLSTIEVGSWVSPKWVPQMANSKEVYESVQKKFPSISFPMLVPNITGLNDSLKSNVREISVFTAASEEFSKKNTNAGIQESLERISDVYKEAKKHSKDIKIRAYISCVLGDPFHTKIDPHLVKDISKDLLRMGCYEVSLGDTVGMGTPSKMKELLDILIGAGIKTNQLAVHCHDTYGMAIANINAAIEKGILTVDSSIAGLGGCPYAPGSSGNVSTEDVLFLSKGLGLETDIKVSDVQVAEVGRWISDLLGRSYGSGTKSGLALLNKMKKPCTK